MNVSEYEISKFIKANPGNYTCTLNGVEAKIYVDEEGTLRVVDKSGYFHSTTTGYPEFVHNDRVDETTSEVVFDETLIRKIKDAFLRKQITHELKSLLSSANAMIEHYRAYNSNNDFRSLEDIYIRMYWLKDIDFEQSGKGTVIIVPDGTGSLEGGNFIKGYIYHADHAAVKFEGVQAWRYKAIAPIDIYNLGVSSWDEWKAIMTQR